MAITFEATYSKKLGLPNFSSHQFSVSICTELANLEQIEAESSRLYQLLQTAVDRDIQRSGYVPVVDPGHFASAEEPTGSPNGSNGSSRSEERWQCSQKQRELLTTIMEERHLELAEVEALAREKCGKELRQLSRPETSALITRLLAR